MTVIITRGRAALVINLKRKPDIHCYYIPVTLVWVTVINNGVPLGTQTAWLSSRSNGIPFEVILVAPVTHDAVTHGSGLPAGVVKGQPAMV